MGGLSSITSALGTANDVAKSTAGLRKAYTDYRSVTAAYDAARQNYDENEREIADQKALQEKQIMLDNEKATQDRKNALRKAVATQQAAFGGNGIDTTDGSGQSAILGLFKSSNEDKAYRNSVDNLKLDNLNTDTLAKRRKNLLALQQNYDSARDGLVKDFGTYTDYSKINKKQNEN